MLPLIRPILIRRKNMKPLVLTNRMPKITKTIYYFRRIPKICVQTTHYTRCISCGLALYQNRGLHSLVHELPKVRSKLLNVPFRISCPSLRTVSLLTLISIIKLFTCHHLQIPFVFIALKLTLSFCGNCLATSRVTSILSTKARVCAPNIDFRANDIQVLSSCCKTPSVGLQASTPDRPALYTWHIKNIRRTGFGISVPQTPRKRAWPCLMLFTLAVFSSAPEN